VTNGSWTRVSISFGIVTVAASVLTMRLPATAFVAAACGFVAAAAASKAQRVANDTITRTEERLASLNESLRERAISGEEQSRFTERLRRDPRGAVRIYSPIYDGEAGRFACVIERMFWDAGWSVERLAAAADVIPPGVSLAERKDDGPFSERFRAVRDAFERCGIRPSLGTFGSDGAGGVHILVGRKLPS
jgi:hypothetical protein